MSVVKFWVRISHISLNCVHVMFLLADGFKLVYSACTSTFLLSTPFSFSSSAFGKTQRSLYSTDMIMYLGRKARIHHCVY